MIKIIIFYIKLFFIKQIFSVSLWFSLYILITLFFSNYTRDIVKNIMNIGIKWVNEKKGTIKNIRKYLLH